MTESELRDHVIEQRKWHENLSDKIKQDCQLKRAVQSGEMHNWIVCMRAFNMSSEELSSYYGQIKDNPDVTSTNELIVKLNDDTKKLHQMVFKRRIEEGLVSDMQLAIAGLK